MITHKRGDSFEYLIVVEGATNEFFNSWDVTCTVKSDMGHVLDTINCVRLIEGDTYSILVKKIDTTKWRFGQHFIDIKFTRPSDGYVITSNSIRLDVVR